MGKKDYRGRVFFSDPERFADLTNAVLHDGKEIIRGDDLSPWDTRVDDGMRDLIGMATPGTGIVLLGIENQEELDFALPLRILEYDVGEYRDQARRIRTNYRKGIGFWKKLQKRAREVRTGEYLYGFPEDGKLIPVITIVLYYGEKWSGPRNLKDMMDLSGLEPETIGAIRDYPLHLVEVQKLTDEDMALFRTDVREALNVIRYSKDKEKLMQLLTSDPAYQAISWDAYAMINEHTDLRMLKIEQAEEGGTVNMCVALEELARDWKEEGIQKGRQEERAESELILQIISRLLDAGDLAEAARITKDSAYREKVLQNYRKHQ